MAIFHPRRAINRRALSALGLASLAVAAWPTAVPAQSFPSRALRLVVPFPAGGGTDAMARALAEQLSKDLGQAVVVDNKAGAGTVIGNDAVAKSPPDGHTLLLNTSAFAIVPSLHPRLPYAGENAFQAVTLLGRAPNVAVVRADSPFKTGAELLAHLRAHPGRLSYGSAGNGTSTHLAAEMLKAQTRLFMTHVPYRGATPAITDLLGGQIDLMFGTLPSVAPFIANGKLRALAVTSARHSPLLPEVPTFAESGAPGYAAPVWYGLFVAAGTPAPVVQRLFEAVERVAQSPEFRQRAQNEGLALSLEPPDAAQAAVRADVRLWRQVVAAQAIKAD